MEHKYLDYNNRGKEYTKFLEEYIAKNIIMDTNNITSAMDKLDGIYKLTKLPLKLKKEIKRIRKSKHLKQPTLIDCITNMQKILEKKILKDGAVLDKDMENTLKDCLSSNRYLFKYALEKVKPNLKASCFWNRMLLGQLEAYKIYISENKEVTLFDAFISGFTFGRQYERILVLPFEDRAIAGIKVKKAAKERGDAQNKQYQEKRPLYQPFVDDYLVRNPGHSYSEACRRAKIKFGVCEKTIKRNTYNPHIKK